MHAYTVGSIVAALAAISLELILDKGRLYREWSFWISLAIIFFFQILVDGYLTKLSSPVVIYSSHHFSGFRFPFSIPIEDFIYGFAMIQLTLTIWNRLKDRYPSR
ncbi:MAG: lycopene cyclase domain-containing protein [Actinomycetota bacterium]|nr:lycopene cyclase domain-containing protein [Actinomycetota bacterium]